MDPCISLCPQEVLIHIFQFLDVHTRLNVSLVCKEWLLATDCHKLLCDIEVKFREETDEGVQLFNHMKRRFEYFSFDSITLSDSAIEFLKKYSRQFVNLSFMNCKLKNEKGASQIHGKILHCDKLKTLKVRYSNIFSLFASIPNVTGLTLHRFSALSDYFISELCKLVFKLEVLSLDCDVSDEVYKRVSVYKEIIQTNPSGFVLSFESIKRLIEKNRTTLRSIEFENSSLSPEALLSISEIKGLNLRSVNFPFKFNAGDIKIFCENQPSLTSLDLSFNSKNTNDTACAVCKCLPNLEVLTMRYNAMIDNCIIEIFQLQQLVKLDLKYCVNISELSYREAVSNLQTFNLKHLNLEFAKISDESLFQLLKRNQNIRYLNVAYTCISNRTLNMICKKLTLLECLILDSCKKISDSGLTGECENCSDSLTPAPLYNLKYLKELDLSSNSLITNKGCIKAIRFLNLLRLSLDGCDRLILDNDFKTLLKKQNPNFQGFITY